MNDFFNIFFLEFEFIYTSARKADSCFVCVVGGGWWVVDHHSKSAV
jgi:hypothetical protein